MRIRLFLILLSLAPFAQAACPPAGWDAAKLQSLKAEKFVVEEAGGRAALAMGLLDCLADPDPALRDGVAFEGWAHWLRGEQLDESARRAALVRL